MSRERPPVAPKLRIGDVVSFKAHGGKLVHAVIDQVATDGKVTDYIVKSEHGEKYSVPSWDSSLTLIKPGEQCPVCGSRL